MMYFKYSDDKSYNTSQNNTESKFISSVKDFGVIFNKQLVLVIETNRKVNYI